MSAGQLSVQNFHFYLYSFGAKKNAIVLYFLKSYWIEPIVNQVNIAQLDAHIFGFKALLLNS